jgi:hypothetical protein
MDCIFLIPGIEGSRLSLGTEEVWPPTPNEMIGGYNRIAKLLDPNTIATGIWDETVIFGLIHYPVYRRAGQCLWRCRGRQIRIDTFERASCSGVME